MPVRHSPCLLIPPTLPPHSSDFSRTLTFSSKDAVGRFAMARAACCTSCLPSLVAALENAKFLFFCGYFQMELSTKIRSFLTSGVFESVRFKRKRGRVERVRAGRGGGWRGEQPATGRWGRDRGRSECRRGFRERRRTRATEQPKNLVASTARDKKKVQRGLARLSTSEWQRLRWRNFKSTTNFCH